MAFDRTTKILMEDNTNLETFLSQLGTMSNQDADDVAITGGTIQLDGNSVYGVNDETTTAENTWSAEKIQTEIQGHAGDATNIISDTDIEIKSTGGNVNFEVPYGNTFNFNRNVEMASPYHFQSDYFTTPGYLDAASWGVRMGQNDAGAWIKFRQLDVPVLEIGRDDGTQKYGIRISDDEDGKPRVEMGYNPTKQAYVSGVEDGDGAFAGAVSADADSGAVSLIVTDGTNTNALIPMSGSAEFVSMATTKYTDVTSAGVKIGETSDTAYLEMRRQNQKVLTLGATDSTDNADKYGLEILFNGATVAGVGYSTDFNGWSVGVTEGTNASGALNIGGECQLIVINNGTPVFNVAQSGEVSTTAGKLPVGYGEAGQVLSTDGNGQTEWIDAAGAGINKWSFATPAPTMVVKNWDFLELDANTELDFSSINTGGQVVVYNINDSEAFVLEISLDGTREFFNYTGSTQATVSIQRGEAVTLVKRPDGSVAYLV